MRELTQEQIAAIHSDAQDTLVVAGAGAGKTTVMVERVRHLLSSGVHPAEMMVLTFTRRAADELKSRLGNYQKPNLNSVMWLGTFHAISFRLLREFGDRLQLDPRCITVLDEHESRSVLLGIASNLYGNRFKKTVLLDYLAALYCGAVRPIADADKVYDAIYKRYRQVMMMEYNCLDFGLLLLEAKRLLVEFPDVRESINKRFLHVLVDEVQDTDETQYDLHDLLCPPAKLFAVGDPRQSIYGFRGARPDLFKRRRPNAKIFSLSFCFRCPPQVLACANRLIAHNPLDPSEKPLVAVKTVPRTSVLYLLGPDHFTREMKEVLGNRKAFAPGDVAVIARTHYTLELAAQVFTDVGIPWHTVSRDAGIRGTDEFKQMLYILRLAYNALDDSAFVMLFRNEWDTDRMRSCMRLKHATGISLLAAAADVMPKELISCGINAVRAVLASAKEISTREAVRLCDEQFAWTSTNNDCVAELLKALEPFHMLHGALAGYSLRSAADDPDLNSSSKVHLMTAHAAKGLEFPMVIIFGFDEGQFPSKRARRESDIQEERRVAYVATTRPKELLLLYQIEDRSRFADEFLIDGAPTTAI